MSSTTRPPAASSTRAQPAEKSFFELQREILLKDIAVSFEHVLANINKLNRSLEMVIAVGNEFSSVEALWSQFETVMAKDPQDEAETHIAREGEREGNEEDEMELAMTHGNG